MKKSLVSALTTALVVGAASTTFAAANPFSDVPADHWAYDAVAQLASDGVVEGYGDGTYRGDRSITRYEMAQMVAKAMAKNDVSAADRALIDRLAAEFSEELNNLGVRVAKLEKHADMVKWTGELRYRYWSTRDEQNDGSTNKNNVNQLQLRLFPTAEVNKNWQVKARLTGTLLMNNDQGNDGKMALTYVYAEGNYGKFQTKLGKMPLYSVADDGLVVDDFFSGAQISYGKDFKITAEAGRWSGLNSRTGSNSAANYQGVELNYNSPKKKFNIGAAYRHLSGQPILNSYNKDNADIWSIGSKYAFDKNIALKGAYANNPSAPEYKTAYNIELDYKGANKANKGSWGAFVAYRYMGEYAAVVPTYNATSYLRNTKGWTVGVSYTPLKNTLTALEYYRGSDLQTGNKDEALFARVSAFF